MITMERTPNKTWTQDGKLLTPALSEDNVQTAKTRMSFTTDFMDVQVSQPMIK